MAKKAPKKTTPKASKAKKATKAPVKTKKVTKPAKKAKKTKANKPQTVYDFHKNRKIGFTIPETGKSVIGEKLPPYVQINLTQ